MCKNSEIERNDEQPLLERLEAYGRTDVYPFHMPGHKRRWVQKRWDIYMRWILRKLMDLTICMNRKAS